MNDLTDAKKSKDRSPSFPFINLEQALERARQFYAEEKRGAAPFARAAMHWGYSESSSGALQTAAALKNYGLMLDVPSSPGKGRQVQLTDSALRILLDQRPDSTERGEYIRQAARAPAIADEVYAKWPDGLPSDTTLNHYLVLEKKFNQVTALKVSRILAENHAFARIDPIYRKSDEGMTHSDLTSATERMVQLGRGHDAGRIVPIPPTPRPGAPIPTLADVPSQMKGAHEERLIHTDGRTTTIQFSAAPTAEVYRELIAFAEFKAKLMDKSRGTAAADPAAPTSEEQGSGEK